MRNSRSFLRVDNKFKNRRTLTTSGASFSSLLSPILVNLYSEARLRDALSGVNEGIRVGGHLIKTVRFADDQATLTSSVKGLQLVMGNMQESVGNMI